jgi:hypothetical protein
MIMHGYIPVFAAMWLANRPSFEKCSTLENASTNSGGFATLAAILRACAYNLLRLCDCPN